MPAKFKGETELKSPIAEKHGYHKEKAHFNINIFTHHSNKGKKHQGKNAEITRRYEVNIPGSTSLFVFIN